MPRYKLLIEYDGSKFYGWQLLQNLPTVQGRLISAIESIVGHSKFELYGAGRTDAGVHALGQVAHLHLNASLNPQKFMIKLNDTLPHSINILDITPVPDSFHARYDAKYRSYVYLISKRRSAFAKNYIWWVKDSLNFRKMSEASKVFIGKKDFVNFTNIDKNDADSTIVEIIKCEIYEQNQIIAVHIIGSHFLWRQVRRMVGCLVQVGRGRLSIKELNSFFLKKSDYPAQHTAPPSGLYLEKVYYSKPNDDEIVRKPNIFLNIL